MVQDCPNCGLTNPPTAERCDCGFDFAARRRRSTHLTDNDLARAAADANNPQYFPAPSLGCGYLLLAIIQGTNGPGGALLVVSFAFGLLGGLLAGGGLGPFLAAFGAVAVGADLAARRFALRCGVVDTHKGSKFAHFPVWVVGFVALVLGGVMVLAART